MEETKISNKLQQSFNELIPYMQYFFEDEIAFTISNTDHFIKVVNSKNINMNAKPDDKLRPGGAAYECIKAKKPISTIVPKEVFGIEIKAIGLPVKDDKNITTITDSFKEQLSQIQHIDASLQNLNSTAYKLKELAE